MLLQNSCTSLFRLDPALEGYRYAVMLLERSHILIQLEVGSGKVELVMREF